MSKISLVFLAFIIYLTVSCQFGLGLKSKECFIKLLIVYVQLPHFGCDAFSLLLLQASFVLLFQDRISHFCYARLLDELGQGERRLLDTTFRRQVLSFQRPVVWDGNDVSISFDVYE